jgi:hypothetical protein
MCACSSLHTEPVAVVWPREFANEHGILPTFASGEFANEHGILPTFASVSLPMNMGFYQHLRAVLCSAAAVTLVRGGYLMNTRGG